ncbi:MAG TPA: bZIP transcription factor [Candidatus Paceibacterota bacterium]
MKKQLLFALLCTLSVSAFAQFEACPGLIWTKGAVKIGAEPNYYPLPKEGELLQVRGSGYVTDDLTATRIYSQMSDRGVPVSSPYPSLNKVLRIGVLSSIEFGKLVTRLNGADLEREFPNGVTERKTVGKFFNYDEMNAAVINSIQALYEKVVNLEAENTALKSRVAKLEKQNDPCLKVTARISESADNPTSKTLIANRSTASSAMLIHAFTIKPKDGDAVLKNIPVKITLAEVMGGTQTINSSEGFGALFNAMVESVWVEVNGHFATEAIASISHTSTTGQVSDVEVNSINFDINGNITIPNGSTAVVKVYVRLAPMPDNGGAMNANSGVTISSSVNGDSIVLGTPNCDAIPPFSITGSSTGYTHTIRTAGVISVMGTASIEPTKYIETGKTKYVVYTIPITLTAVSKTFYVGQSAEWATRSGSGTAAVAFALQSASAPSTDITSLDECAITNGSGSSGAVGYIFSSPQAPVQNLGYRIDEGVSRTFILQVVVSPGSGPEIQNEALRVALKSIKYYTNDSLSAGETIDIVRIVENNRTDFELYIVN